MPWGLLLNHWTFIPGWMLKLCYIHDFEWGFLMYQIECIALFISDPTNLILSLPQPMAITKLEVHVMMLILSNDRQVTKN